MRPRDPNPLFLVIEGGARPMLDPRHYVPPASIEFDHASRRNLLIYRPAGALLDTHEPRRWYVRPLDDLRPCPYSRPFLSHSEAIAAIHDGSWDLIVNDADRRPIRARREERCDAASPSDP